MTDAEIIVISALALIVSYVDEVDGAREVYEEVTAAIAKAEGAEDAQNS